MFAIYPVLIFRRKSLVKSTLINPNILLIKDKYLI